MMTGTERNVVVCASVSVSHNPLAIEMMSAIVAAVRGVSMYLA